MINVARFCFSRGAATARADGLLATLDARSRYRICEECLAGVSEDERNSASLLADRVSVALINALENV
jgi:hypothetical protein